MRAWFLGILLVSGAASAQNVLLRRAPAPVPSLPMPERVTDGTCANDGDAWDQPRAMTFGPDTTLEWDLGASTTLGGAALQADNNDVYVVSVSEDGTAWSDIWNAEPVNGPGLQTRSTDRLNARGRYVRLTAHGGDQRYSVAEFELFGPSMRGSNLLRVKWLPRRPIEVQSILLLAGAAVLLALSSRRAPRALRTLLAIVALTRLANFVLEVTPLAPSFAAALPQLRTAAAALIGVVMLVELFLLAERGGSRLLVLALAGVATWAAWSFMVTVTVPQPDPRASLPWLRAAAALLAVLVLARDRLWRGRWPSSPAFTVGGLAVSAALSVWCFLNLDAPQFFDHGQRRGTWLHHYDMRTYFPIAKYFPELRFDGVYAASVLAVADGRNLDDFDGQAIRDLRTHVLTNVRDSKAHLLEVRRRFTPERWAEFTGDMRYFRNAMSDGGFLGSMNDHGGNATPVWFMSARAMFVSADASDATLWRGVIADVALLALAFLAIGWAWGARTALLAVIVFGAMDFYQFGSNWFGAALRHDWLSLWAIGVALLKKRRWAWAGAALAWSAWIRAFPALTLITLSFPVLFLAGKQLLQGQRASSLETAKPLLKVALGVVIASVVLVGLSTWLFGADAWTEWLRKVQTLDKDNHLNNISFRTYINVDRNAWRVAVPASLVVLFIVLRRASMHRAAAWGVALLPIVFNPANYYLHSAFLLVTLAAERAGEARLRGLLVWLTLLAMCVASYFTNVSPDMVQHFRGDTIICFVTLGVLLLLELWRPSETSTPLQRAVE